MAPTTIRKAIGAVKDQTSIGIAKVAGTAAPDLEVLIVKATSHDNDPANDKYIREILNLMSYSKGYVNAFVFAISKRLSKTHDWIVAVKALMLVHRVLVDGEPMVGQEIMYASRKGARVLNMSDFRDEAHSNSWDFSSFVKSYALYLDQKLEFSVHERKLRGVDEKKRYSDEYQDFGIESGYGTNPHSRSYGGRSESVGKGDKKGGTPIRDMEPERIVDRLIQWLQLLDRFLACKPTGAAKSSRIILVALYLTLKESFKLYSDICEMLNVLQDRFMEMEYADCVKGFDAYLRAAKVIDELLGFYSWCKDTGVARSSEYPQVQKIPDKYLGTLEGFVKERENKPKSSEKTREVISSSVTVNEKEALQSMNGIKALPPSENYNPPPMPQSRPEPQPRRPPSQQVIDDLVNLKDDALSADLQSNKLELALFSGPPNANGNGSWEVFPSDGEPEMTSAWQNPAAESGNADWELALVETSSNLSKQKTDMGGGLDPLLLNGMYDQGGVTQHVGNARQSGGSSSSVALPGMGKRSSPVLAMPAPDGTMQTVGHQDPFAASLVVPPPSYVQIADMERKQHLLVQEQHVWHQYRNNGMQGQVSLANAGGVGLHQMIPNGLPPVNGMGQQGGYNYTPY